jgi:hypothetical protein
MWSMFIFGPMLGRGWAITLPFTWWIYICSGKKNHHSHGNNGLRRWRGMWWHSIHKLKYIHLFHIFCYFNVQHLDVSNEILLQYDMAIQIMIAGTWVCRPFLKKPTLFVMLWDVFIHWHFPQMTIQACSKSGILLPTRIWKVTNLQLMKLWWCDWLNETIHDTKHDLIEWMNQ